MQETMQIHSPVDDPALQSFIIDALESTEGTLEMRALVDSEQSDAIAEPVTAIAMTIIVGTATAHWVADFFYRIRQRFRPLVVVDATGPTVVITVHEDIAGMRGEVIVKSRAGEEIQLVSPTSPAELATGIFRALGTDGKK